MNKLSINTAQNVKFEYNLASLGARIIAFALDYFLIICYGLFVYYLLHVVGLFKSNDLWLISGVYMLFFLPAFLYSFLMESLFYGQTVGKMLMNIKVVKIDGTRADVYQYFTRWICSIIDIFLSVGALGISSIIISKKAQRIGDIAADTAVISIKKNSSLQSTLYTEIAQAHNLTFPQVVNLSDGDANSIKDIYQIAQARKDYNIILALSNRLVNLLNVQPTMGPEQFIDTIIKDYYYTYRDR